MLMQSFLSSSIEAAPFFVPNLGKKALLYNWMSGNQTWHMYPKFDDRNGRCKGVGSIPNEKANADDLCLPSPPASVQLSTLSASSEDPALNFVYRRRKRQRNSSCSFPIQTFSKDKRSVDSFSMLSFGDPSMAAEEQLVDSLNELETLAIEDPVMTCLVNNNAAPTVFNSEIINGLVEERNSDEAPKSVMHKIIYIDSVNDTPKVVYRRRKRQRNSECRFPSSKAERTVDLFSLLSFGAPSVEAEERPEVFQNDLETVAVGATAIPPPASNAAPTVLNSETINGAPKSILHKIVDVDVIKERENDTPNFVYQRKKQQPSSACCFPTQTSSEVKITVDGLSVLSINAETTNGFVKECISDAAPTFTHKIIDVDSINDRPKYVYRRRKPHRNSACSFLTRTFSKVKKTVDGLSVLSFDAETKNGFVEECIPNVAPKTIMHKIIDVDSINDRPKYVYRRRKPQRKSACSFLTQKVKRTVSCRPISSFSDPSTEAEEEHVVSHNELGTLAIEATFMPPPVSNAQPAGLNSKITNGSAAERLSDLAPKSIVHKIVNGSVNDSCSSSKSTMEVVSVSIKSEAGDTSECSSSSVFFSDALVEGTSERGLCIALLRSQGLLPVKSAKDCSCSERVGESACSSSSWSCKHCGMSDSTTKLLICDNCEEAYHLSCCQPRAHKIPDDEWFCQLCLKKKCLKKSNVWKFSNIITGKDTQNEDESNHIEAMLNETEPYRTSVRIGKGFQAHVPEWSGPTNYAVDSFGEPAVAGASDLASSYVLNADRCFKWSPTSNWLQCRQVIDENGEGGSGTICGKWRRAPLLEVQTDTWECFCAFLWDPSHADCVVPQELEVDEVMKQLKSVRHLVAATRLKLDRGVEGHSHSSDTVRRNVTDAEPQ